MLQARLGTAGPMVSRICLGTMTFGFQCDEATSFAILDAAAGSGINFIHTSDVYPKGGTFELMGRTEEILGRWLRHQRSEFVIAAKSAGPHSIAYEDRAASGAQIVAALDATLRRLQTDYVDIYQLYDLHPRARLDDVIDALDLVVRSGRARYVTCSKLEAGQLGVALSRSTSRNSARFTSIMQRYNLVLREAESRLFPLCLGEGLGVMVYNPLAGGMLTGKYDESRAPTAGRFVFEDYRDRYWRPEVFKALDRLRAVAAEAGSSLTTLALRWVLANPAVTCAVIGASRPEHVLDDIVEVDHGLDGLMKDRLDAITASFVESR